MIGILTVCTANICRSPLAAQLLRLDLAPYDVPVLSAGTRAVNDLPMTAESIELAVERGVDPVEATAHRSRILTERQLAQPALILAMTRQHRRQVVELAPVRTRTTFTIREFARLAHHVPDAELAETAHAAGTDPDDRLLAVVGVISARRGLDPQPADAADDDVIDPYGGPREIYQRSAAQIEPAVASVVRTLRLALDRTL